MDASDLLHDQLVLAASKVLWRSPWDENARLDGSLDDHQTDLFADARPSSYADVQPLRLRRYRSHSSPLVSPLLSEASSVSTPTISPTLVHALPEPWSPPAVTSLFDSETDSSGPSPATDYAQYFGLPIRPHRSPLNVPKLILVQPTPMLQSPDLSAPASPRTTLALQRRRWSMSDSPSGCWYYPGAIDPTRLSPYQLNVTGATSRHLVKAIHTQEKRFVRWGEIALERPVMGGPPTGLVDDALRPILEPISPVSNRYGSSFGLGIQFDTKTPFNSPVRPRRQRS